MVVPLLKVGQQYPFAEVIQRIRNAVSPEVIEREIIESKFFQKKLCSQLELSYKEMKTRSKREVHLSDAIGEIAAEMVVPYPPGIPLLLPGEMITLADIHQILWLFGKGTKFQGGNSLKEGYIKVY